jgi:hypothetical protein
MAEHPDSAEHPVTCKAGAERAAWEKPALVELKIGTETKSNRDAEDPAEPPPPGAPMTKLGFSFEWGFPMSSRTEK